MSLLYVKLTHNIVHSLPKYMPSASARGPRNPRALNIEVIHDIEAHYTIETLILCCKERPLKGYSALRN
jgi:hypothetical protein